MKRIPITAVSNEKALTAVRAYLKAGKVLVCPTDTVYGLLVDATNASAVRKVFLIKQREKGKPLPVFVKDIAMAKRFARISSLQEHFLKKTWPGKVTVLLKSRDILPKELGTSEKIGLRIPNYSLILKIFEQLPRPLTGTSANLSGNCSVLDSKAIQTEFWHRRYKPDILIDAGKLPFSRPSKVIDITGEKPKILRR